MIGAPAHRPTRSAAAEYRHVGAGRRTLGAVLRAVVAVTLFVGCFLTMTPVEPAIACSCAGSPQLGLEFTGEAVSSTVPANFGKLWRFRVIAAAGTVGAGGGEVVEVNISGDDPPDKNGLQSSSSCSIGPYPVEGGIYEVGAYQGSDADGTRRYFASGCGGYVREVSAPPVTTELARPEPRAPSSESERAVPFGASLAAGITLAVTAALTIRASRR